MKNKDGIVRVGGVGTGRIFQWAHLNTYPRLWAKARLVGFYDVNPARAREARHKYAALLEKYAAEHSAAAEAVRANIAELRVHDTLGACLEQVDLIDVCTTARGRLSAALAALDKGVHAMVEKPLSRTWIEADRAVRAFADKPDVFFQLNDDNVAEPKIRMLHDLIAGGAIGRVHHMSLIRGCEVNSPHILRSGSSAVENGGGCLMDYGTHGLAGAWYALGMHMELTAVEAVRIAVRFPHRHLEQNPAVPATLEVDDDAHVRLLFTHPQTGSWAEVFLEASWSGGEIGLGPKIGQQAQGYLRVEGDDGVIDATDKEKMILTRWDGGQTVLPLRVFPGETQTFEDEVEGFVDCVRTHTAPKLGVAFGAQIMAAVGAAYLSALRGKVVTLAEFKDHCRQYLKKYGDHEQAESALLEELLKPYRSQEK